MATIQIPNITINGNDYWESHKSQYNEMIGKSITPLSIDLKGYPTNNTITVEDPTDEYMFTDNKDTTLVDYPFKKSSELAVKIVKLPQFWEVPMELTETGEYGFPTSNFNVKLPDDVTGIGEYGLYHCFSNCKTITSFESNNVTSIDRYGLTWCFSFTKITSLSFPALTSSSFGSNTNQFNNMLTGVTGCTVHFPSNLQSVIGSWDSVTNGFGGTNTTVLFDLPATS